MTKRGHPDGDKHLKAFEIVELFEPLYVKNGLTCLDGVQLSISNEIQISGSGEGQFFPGWYKCLLLWKYSKTCLKRPLSKRPQVGFQLSLNAGQKYCRMLPFVMKIFGLSIFEWPFYTGFTVFT